MGNNKRNIFQASWLLTTSICIIVLFSITALFSFTLFAEENHTIFISTYPYNAQVYINNTNVGKSPIVLRNLTSTFDLRLEKPGFYKVEKKVILEKPMNYIFFNLIPGAITLSILDTFSLKDNDTIYAPPYSITNLTPGLYSVSIQDNYLTFKKDETLTVMSIVSLSIFITSTVLYLIPSFDKYREYMATTSIISGTYTTALVILNPSLFGTQPVINPSPMVFPDKDLYENGLQFIRKTDYNNAIDTFLELKDKFPDSFYIPHALYHIAFCYDLLNQNDKSKNYYQELITNYPIPEFYDVSLFSLGLIYYNNKLFEESLQAFSSIVFYDKNFISSNTIYSYLLLNNLELFFNGADSQQAIIYYFDILQKNLKNNPFRKQIYLKYALFLIKINNKKDAKSYLDILATENDYYGKEAKKLLSTYY